MFGVGGFYNSNIGLANLLAAGQYVVGVSRFASTQQSGAPYITGSQIPEGGTYTLNISSNATNVPEPLQLSLLGLGLAALGLHKAIAARATGKRPRRA